MRNSPISFKPCDIYADSISHYWETCLPHLLESSKRIVRTFKRVSYITYFLCILSCFGVGAIFTSKTNRTPLQELKNIYIYRYFPFSRNTPRIFRNIAPSGTAVITVDFSHYAPPLSTPAAQNVEFTHPEIDG